MFPKRKKKSDVAPAIKRKKGRARIVFLSILFALSFSVGLSYHVFEWSTQIPATPILSLLYELVIIVGYVSLATVLSTILNRRGATPAKSIWAIFITGGLAVILSSVISRIGGGNLGAPGFDLETGVPLALASIFKMNVLTLIMSIFAFVLLLKLQDLVLVKRSKPSQRNWYAMLGSMAVVSLSVVTNHPGDPLTELQTVALIIATVFMVVNAFKLSWIVFLSFREKISTIGLCFLLGLLLFLGIGIMGEGPVSRLLIPGGYAFMEHYSYPLTIFLSQSTLFGLMYCTTSFLSLLFHLPTSSEFTQRAGERAAMHSLTHLVGQVFDSEKLYSTITSAPVAAGSAVSSWLAVSDVESGTLTPRLVASHGIELDRIPALLDFEALYDHVSQHREPLHLGQAPTDHRIDARPGDGIGCLLVTPLIARDEVLGALFVAKDVVHGFEHDDLQTISIFAAQAAVAMDNAKLFVQQVEKERLSRELSIAREVQQKLLPQHLPDMPGLTIAASSVSAHEVGGDYFDFVELDDHRLGVIIGDVSGKGTSAAFYMAEMQGIFRSLSRLAPSPCEFLSHANAALAQSLDRNVFISAVYGVLDLEAETFVIARAGHCPAAIVDQTGKSRYIRSRGIGLGLDRSTLFKSSLVEEIIPLSPGDVFGLYTDGVVESRSPEGEEYGYDRLLSILSASRHEDAAEIHRAVLDDLNVFLQDQEYDDDMTLVIIKWHGVAFSETSALIKTQIESTLL